MSWFHGGIICCWTIPVRHKKHYIGEVSRPLENSMSLGVVVQFITLAVIAGIGVGVIYAISELRKMYAQQQAKFVMAISAVGDIRKLQPEFLSVLQRMESD